MIDFETFHITNVKFYPYRTVRAWPIILTIPFKKDDEVQEFREILAAKAEKPTDNHTLYEVTYENDEKCCFWFSDWKCYVALKPDNTKW